MRYDLHSLTRHLQSKIDEMEISQIQKDVCRRSIWYCVVKDLGLNKSDIKARKSYNVSGCKLKTKEYTSDVMLKTLGEDYFKKKHFSKNRRFLNNINLEG